MLTKAEEERLNLLQEECAEIIQAVSKIKRFGFDSKKPRDPDGPNNKEHLETELGGLAAVLDLMIVAGDVDEEHCEAAQMAKACSIHTYTKHQGEECEA